ncbi:TraR/DksA family transcriptional regulator [Clostridium cylindrosporum]|uniref:Zinc finger DksA/TraR C4-type domain-containing protein n=1 Tax=Clostridium cylindrosporum DSM 605 TaxID=1121307 RepID=A0A0J8D6F7_CLOCY|nr:TraR/DksA C4-type zinc finger protein [Clostridium cylindrosporum]KMT21437.1 hypothetical protein CLCY_2c01970 [Clostridium cylindrosporum DSM 605]
MNGKFINNMEDKLESYKDETMKTIGSLADRIRDVNDPAFSVNHSQVTNHPADIGTELFDKELNIALINNQRELTNKIEDALDRINEGNYGTCEMCGKGIEPERLEILPYTTSCADCAIEGTVNLPVKQNYTSEATLRNFYDVYEELEEENGAYMSDELTINMQDPNYIVPGCVEKIEEISNEEYRNQL